MRSYVLCRSAMQGALKGCGRCSRWMLMLFFFFFFSSRRRHTSWNCDSSSDVCSSDLRLHRRGVQVDIVVVWEEELHQAEGVRRAGLLPHVVALRILDGDGHRLAVVVDDLEVALGRSEERRVGKECRSRWSREHEKKKK